MGRHLVMFLLVSQVDRSGTHPLGDHRGELARDLLNFEHGMPGVGARRHAGARGRVRVGTGQPDIGNDFVGLRSR